MQIKIIDVYCSMILELLEQTKLGEREQADLLFPRHKHPVVALRYLKNDPKKATIEQVEVLRNYLETNGAN